MIAAFAALAAVTAPAPDALLEPFTAICPPYLQATPYPDRPFENLDRHDPLNAPALQTATQAAADRGLKLWGGEHLVEYMAGPAGTIGLGLVFPSCEFNVPKGVRLADVVKAVDAWAATSPDGPFAFDASTEQGPRWNGPRYDVTVFEGEPREFYAGVWVIAKTRPPAKP